MSQGIRDVVVIGGGLAGLTAAATASADGASVVVLEAHGPGGRARVTEREGFTFNLGAHALYLGGEGVSVLRRLGVEPKGSPPPLGGYVLAAGGGLHQMPVGPGSILRTTALAPRSKVALGRLLARLPRLQAEEHAGVSVDAWIAEQGLRDDAVGVLQALVRIGSYSDALDDLSAGAAIQQLQRASSKGVLYLDGGWAQLIDGLRRQVEVRTGAGVAAISDATGHGIEVRLHDGSVVVGRSVVVAAGAPPACAAVLPPDVTRPWGDLGAPSTAACLDVAVRGVPTPGYVLGVDEPIYGTIQGPPARQAPAGDSVVAVIRYGATQATRDRADLDRWLGLMGVRPDVVVRSRFLARMTVVGAAPRAVNGGLAGRPPITATGVAGVFLAGDWIGPEGMLADAAFASGYAAGRAAAERAGSVATTMVS